MPIDIQSILSELETGIVDLAKTTLKDFTNQATMDGKQLLSILKDDLIRWTQEIAEGKLSKEVFETLLIGQKDLIKMSALTQAGLALAKIDEFKNGIFDLILNTITGVVKL